MTPRQSRELDEAARRLTPQQRRDLVRAAIAKMLTGEPSQPNTSAAPVTRRDNAVERGVEIRKARRFDWSSVGHVMIPKLLRSR